jgi:acyl-CoA synthetase (AMP-forming)/AMP-acid ligase II
LLATPLFHVAALTLMTANMYGGRRVVLLYKWDADEALRVVAREGVTDMSGPPTIVREFVDAAKSGTHDTSSLRSLVSGAALTPPDLVADIHDTFGDRVSPGTGYGSTETMSTVLTINGSDFVARPTSVGRALPIVEIRICDADGRVTEPGTVGELQVRGPQISPGYYHQPEETLAAFRDGWYRTGDLARLDQDGFVHLSGRLKDVVIRGGENVQCAEVESALARHPAVLESAVFGIPHALLGEEVAAVVRTHAEATVSADELTMFLRASIAAFKVPTSLRFTTEPLPRTATGKIVKARLKSSEPVGHDQRRQPNPRGRTE